MKYKSSIILGDRYRDEQTGTEGTAVALVFFQHGCERVDLELGLTNNEMKFVSFDAPRLTHIDTGKVAKARRPGGPDKSSDTLRARNIDTQFPPGQSHPRR